MPLEVFLKDAGAILVAVLRPGVPFWNDPVTYEEQFGSPGKLVVDPHDGGNTRIWRLP